MGTTNSTARVSRSKPAKPYPDFPLFAHATGRWAKKIKGKLHYFGPWADWQAAKAEYDRTKDDLFAGRTPAPPGDGLTIKTLCNKFLARKKQQVAMGEIAPRARRDYEYTTDRIVKVFGLTRLVSDLKPADFERLVADMAKTLSPVTRKVEIQKTRAVFNYAFRSELIVRPVRFGPAFDPPSRKILKKARQQNGPRMFEADEIRRMIDAATVQFRAMIYLGINCGFGNNDCATLTFDVLDLENGWHNHPRPKTGAERRCKLWFETTEALRAAIAKRKMPQDPADKNLVFLTIYGKPWVRFSGKTWSDAVTVVCRLLLRDLGIKRPGVNFYALRHTFETIGGGCKDQTAVDHVMGHVDQSMAATYRERIDDERLEAVTDHIHGWLFSKNQAQ